MEVKLSRGIFARQRLAREKEERAKGIGITEILSNKSDTVNVLAAYKFQPEILPCVGEKRRVPKSCRECVKANREGERGDDEPELGIGNCFMLANRNRNKPYTQQFFAEICHFWDRGGNPKLFNRFVKAEDLIDYSEFKEEFQRIQEEDQKKKSSTTKSPSSNESNESTCQLSNDLILDTKTQLTLNQFVQRFGVKRMRAWLQHLMISFNGWILSKIFNWIFDGVCYHKASLKSLRIATDSGLPIIYIPIYKSSLDSILLPWTLLTLGISPLPLRLEPRTQLQIPGYRTFSKLFGGLGVDRIADPRWGYSQMTNLAAFSYMRLSILQGNSLQMMIEPHRSRTGKTSRFLAGNQILNLIMDMYKEKELEDAFIVPVSINYEKLPEQHIVEHAQMESTNCEKNALRLSWRKLIGSWFGYVRVDFSQPIRLRDFRYRKPYEISNSFRWQAIPWSTENHSTSGIIIPAQEFQFDERLGSVASLISLYAENDSLYGMDGNNGARDYNDEENLSTALTQHILYDAQKASTFMSTNLLSFLLLKKFRNGTSLENLVKEMCELREEIYTKRRDVGFSGEMGAIIQRAIKLLGPSIISVYKDKDDGTQLVKPTGTTKSFLVLEYYANPIVQLFIREACVSTAILSIVGDTYKALLNTSFTLTTSEDELIQRTSDVGHLLLGEFILTPPCESMSKIMLDTISDLSDYSYLYIHKKKEIRPIHDFDESEDEYDDDEYEYGDGLNNRSMEGQRFTTTTAKSDVAVRVERIEFINNEEIWRYHEFHRSLITPYLQFYRIGLTVLARLTRSGDVVDENIKEEDPLDGTKEELELRDEIMEEARKLLTSSKFFNAEEIITVDTARNFLHHMSTMGLIGSWADAKTEGKRRFYLMDEYERNPHKIQELIGRIMTYITY